MVSQPRRRIKLEVEVSVTPQRLSR
jgi:hypothetical protein